MSNLVGQQIKHYRIDAIIGRGGMGTVYRAHDLRLDRPVALKMMHRQYSEMARFRQRFMQEARAIARLGHSSIVTIHDFDSVQGEYFIVMELVIGIDMGLGKAERTVWTCDLTAEYVSINADYRT